MKNFGHSAIGASLLAAVLSAHAAAPGVWTSAGSMSSAHAMHTATRLPSGRVLVTGDVTANAATDLYDPVSNSWSAAASMNTGRSAASASLLGNGTVLVAGGNTANNCITSFPPSETVVVCYATALAEIFTPSGNVWNAAAPLTVARQGHTATVLASGKVLVAGGASDCTTVTTPTTQSGYCTYDGNAEIYDPASNAWSPAGTLTTPRQQHTATLLSSGKVLLAGGYDDNGVLASAEIYDPVANTWTAVASLATGRLGHTATLLTSGKVYVAGGEGSSGGVASAELYDAATNSWTAAASLSVGRYGHTATLLASGDVLLAGGGVGVDLYQPVSNSTVQASPLIDSRSFHTATLLASGKVVVAGGIDQTGEVTTAELFDPNSATYTVTASASANGAVSPATQSVNAGGHVSIAVTPAYASSALDVHGDTCSLTEQADGVTWITGSIAADCAITARFLGPMSASRSEFTATLLATGKVLVAGGSANAQADIFDPQTDTWSSGGTMTSLRYAHSATLLPSGDVLVAGGTSGLDSGSTLATSELYNPVTNAWTPVGSMLTQRSNHAAVLLPTGKVLVAGSLYGGQTGKAELFNPATNSWSAAAAPSFDRASPNLVVLDTGKALLFGDGPSSQLYNPSTNSWSTGGNQPVAVFNQTASLLSTGKVLAVGGEDSNALSVATTALYDPATNTWVAGPSLRVPRAYHTQTTMPSGKVIVLGGYDATTISNYSVLTSAEEYDPATNSWSTIANLGAARSGHTATLLSNGRILVAGGDVNGSPSAELYGVAIADVIFRNGFE